MNSYDSGHSESSLEYESVAEEVTSGIDLRTFNEFTQNTDGVFSSLLSDSSKMIKKRSIDKMDLGGTDQVSLPSLDSSKKRKPSPDCSFHTPSEIVAMFSDDSEQIEKVTSDKIDMATFSSFETEVLDKVLCEYVDKIMLITQIPNQFYQLFTHRNTPFMYAYTGIYDYAIVAKDLIPRDRHSFSSSDCPFACMSRPMSRVLSTLDQSNVMHQKSRQESFNMYFFVFILFGVSLSLLLRWANVSGSSNVGGKSQVASQHPINLKTFLNQIVQQTLVLRSLKQRSLRLQVMQ